eukprot:SAG22_NODE_358_length_11759_cov_39.384563_6_plen_464_part_00
MRTAAALEHAGVDLVASAALAAAMVLPASLLLARGLTAAAGAAGCGCDEFCAGRCAYNATPPQMLTLYRRTPATDLRLADHDTGSAEGDAEFSLYSFSYAWQCLAGGTPRDCSFLQNDTVTVSYTVQVDGEYGPYLACMPPRANASAPAPAAPPGPRSLWHCGVHGGPPEWDSCKWRSDPAGSCPRALRTVGKMPIDFACSSRGARGGPGRPLWEVWRCNVSKRFAGAIDRADGENSRAWFSTPAAGECVGAARIGDGSGCTWRVVSQDKVVPSAVLDDAMAQLVESYANSSSATPSRFALALQVPAAVAAGGACVGRRRSTTRSRATTRRCRRWRPLCSPPGGSMLSRKLLTSGQSLPQQRRLGSRPHQKATMALGFASHALRSSSSASCTGMAVTMQACHEQQDPSRQHSATMDRLPNDDRILFAGLKELASPACAQLVPAERRIRHLKASDSGGSLLRNG